ncbi:TIGR03936 family radical SAM-associated protein [Actinomycetospora endophytica]|uniref:TIGR03936 family radical SAM-associated protein n=1 Tax=Actinomycetospora endophytica TaxID=2291215 RepID=A0ABS8PID5_9PSEU|nr:TIGR03936 family radical SAM-associated protein [Actinomycetospora endophytica]MCD2198030.1 TIGR03936 family radical SAM-associated protein [Actinomycetospora endophytica]
MSRQGTAAHPSAPTVAKVRMRFAKRGRARFSSHRDVARAMEWALRRAGVPVSLSHGFSPHPRLSWLGAAPTGAASEAEFVEIGLTVDLDPAVVAREVDAVLPEGLSVIDVVRAGPGALADRIDASVWRIAMPGVDPQQLAEAVAALEATEVVEVERMTKNGPRTLDVRAALVDLTVEGVNAVTDTPGECHPNDGRAGDDAPGDGPRPAGDDTGDATGEVSDRRARAQRAGCGTLTAVVRHTTPAVRPDDVVSALRSVAGLEPPVPVTATRMEQGRLGGSGELLDPLEADRATTGRETVPARHAGEDRPD